MRLDTRALALAFAVAWTSASVGARANSDGPAYTFSTDSGQITRDGAIVTEVNGTPLAAFTSTTDQATWTFHGAFKPEANATVRIIGERVAIIKVFGNLRILPTVTLDCSGTPNGAGAGGGRGGRGALGGIGREAAPVGSVASSNGANASAAGGGAGGTIGADGGDGGSGDGNAGDAGHDAGPPIAGSNGVADGEPSPEFGQPGAYGVNQDSITGGAGGARNLQMYPNRGFGGTAVTHANGGAGGAVGARGSDGQTGHIGRDGDFLDGGFHGEPGGGAMHSAIDPTRLAGGSGGGGGGGGQGGGGGGSGSSGSGGGGGGAGGADALGIIPGGGGGGGGAGGLGGMGGHGGDGGNGGAGGHGGGGLQLIATGRLDIGGTVLVSGGDGMPGILALPGTPGQPGHPGGQGGSGVTVGAGRGGDGGNGGAGGDGARGGKGADGEYGGGGSGGTLFVSGTIIDGDGTIDISGGSTPVPANAGENGRIFLGDKVANPSGGRPGPLVGVLGQNTFGSNVEVHNNLAVDFVTDYFSGLRVPCITKDEPGANDLQGGPAPCGLLPASAVTAAGGAIAAAIANAPVFSKIAIVRFPGGAPGLDLEYVGGNGQPLDMFVIVNVGGGDLYDVQFNGSPLHTIDAATLDGCPTCPGSILTLLEPEQAWAVLGPEGVRNNTPMSYRVGPNSPNESALLTIPATASGVVTLYDPPFCSIADVGRQGGEPPGDGRLDMNDFVVYVNHFFDRDPRADIGRQGGVPPGDGQFDNNDFVVYVNVFFNGCAN